MKPHPRIRKTIKWGGAVVTVLLVVVWVGSFNRSIARFDSFSGWTTRFMILNGGITYAAVQSPPPLWPRSGWHSSKETGSQRIWWFSLLTASQAVNVVIPLWPLTLAAASVALSAWRLDTLARRRARLNLCPKCNYDRTGLAPVAKCPECGTAPLNM